MVRDMTRTLLFAAAIAAFGCRSEPSSKTGGGSGTATALVTDASGPQRGGNVRLPSNEPRFLNPILETRFDLANTLMFEGLVGVDAKNELIGRLAKSWTVSEDGLVITFKLRENAMWHDGKQVTSKDVAFTFDAVRRSPQTLWKSYMAPVSKVEVPDDTTVVVTYTAPYGVALATWTMPILPAHAYRTGDDLLSSPGNREAVGSGPFKLVRWEANKRIILGAHDRWWAGRPMLDTVELVLNVSDGEMLGQLRRGQLEWAPIRNVDDQAELSQGPDLREQFEHSEVVEARMRLIAWNTDKRPFEDKRVRQALTMALDRGRVVEDVLHGQGQVLSAPLFPTMFGTDPSIAPLPFDLEKSKKMLDEVVPAKPPTASGMPPLRFTIEMISVESLKGPVTDAAFAIFRRDLEQVGVGLKLAFLPAREYFDKIAKRDFDAAFFGWLPDIPDPDPYVLLHSSSIGVGANYAGFANADIDRLLDEARRATTRNARKELYAKVHAILADEVPYTPLYAPFGHYAWTRRLHGVSARDLGPQPLVPGIARWWLER
jgi:peptide/nickel transport system substrate-binding protein